MPRYICTKVCYWKENLWSVGDVITATRQENVPEHFEEAPTESEIRHRSEIVALQAKCDECSIEWKDGWSTDEYNEALDALLLKPDKNTQTKPSYKNKIDVGKVDISKLPKGKK